MDHAGGEEDDGYLVTYVHNEASGESSMVVYDAKTMAAEPVARVVCVKTKSSCLMAVTVVVQSHETQSFLVLIRCCRSACPTASTANG